MSHAALEGSNYLSLADRVVRRRTQARAIEEIYQRWPELSEVLAAAYERGAAKYPSLRVDRPRFAAAALGLFGRYWAKRLREDRAVPLTEVAREFGAGFLEDFLLLIAAEADPFAAAEAFFALNRAVSGQVEALERTARSRIPARSLGTQAFRAKFVGAVIYHFLHPLRLLPAPGSTFPLLDLAETARRLIRKLQERDLACELLRATALAYSDAETVQSFRESHSFQIRDNFRKMRIREPLASELIDDVVGTACLKGCSFFAFGTLEGWLWSVQKSYVMEAFQAPGGLPLEESGVEPEVVEEPERQEEIGRLRQAIKEALGTLAPDDRELVCEVARGVTLVELAGRLGVAPSTVMRRRDRLLHELRRRLLASLIPAELGPGEREAAAAEILETLPLVYLDLDALSGRMTAADAGPAGGGPGREQTHDQEEGEDTPARGPGCLVPRF